MSNKYPVLDDGSEKDQRRRPLPCSVAISKFVHQRTSESHSATKKILLQQTQLYSIQELDAGHIWKFGNTAGAAANFLQEKFPMQLMYLLLGSFEQKHRQTLASLQSPTNSHKVYGLKTRKAP